ncbi:hypothetical protein SETIT_2G199700v2 [Setaria italica]|uniref:Uncharacterized protein n=1 Tax=Setaria italica TaxID=4555 RepID=A0A368Q1D2_SETIT|nr:hypothetical protein SETIT_2G199700v2 [Setaria italica]
MGIQFLPRLDSRRSRARRLGTTKPKSLRLELERVATKKVTGDPAVDHIIPCPRTTRRARCEPCAALQARSVGSPRSRAFRRFHRTPAWLATPVRPVYVVILVLECATANSPGHCSLQVGLMDSHLNSEREH